MLGGKGGGGGGGGRGGKGNKLLKSASNYRSSFAQTSLIYEGTLVVCARNKDEKGGREH